MNCFVADALAFEFEILVVVLYFNKCQNFKIGIMGVQNPIHTVKRACASFITSNGDRVVYECVWFLNCQRQLLFREILNLLQMTKSDVILIMMILKSDQFHINRVSIYVCT